MLVNFVIFIFIFQRKYVRCAISKGKVHLLGGKRNRFIKALIKLAMNTDSMN